MGLWGVEIVSRVQLLFGKSLPSKRHGMFKLCQFVAAAGEDEGRTTLAQGGITNVADHEDDDDACGCGGIDSW